MIVEALISRYLKKQGIVALSSCEAEYVAFPFASCQALMIRMLLKELKIEQTARIRMLVVVLKTENCKYEIIC